MNKSIILCALAIISLLLISSIVGCQKEPQPTATPALSIMVESNTVDAGSSVMVSGSNFKPHQRWVWVELRYKAFDPPVAIGIVNRGDADENGSVYIVIDIVEDAVPRDYEVEISTGKSVHNRDVIVTFPILIKSRGNLMQGTSTGLSKNIASLLCYVLF